MTSDQWIFLQLTIPDEDVKPDLPRKQVIDVSPVLEWLNNLGLSRYNEAFIKEEIDWDTLKWLTEEVCFLTLFNLYKCTCNYAYHVSNLGTLLIACCVIYHLPLQKLQNIC